MKYQIEETTTELLSQARLEFLENGFLNANIRRISENSGVSTHAIYTRFGNKEGLFDELVKTSALELKEKIKNLATEIEKAYDFKTEKLECNTQIIDYVLEHVYLNLNDFTLIFCSSAGTVYENYIEEISIVDEKLSKKILKKTLVLESRAEMSDLFIHSIYKNLYRNIVDFVKSGLNYRQAKKTLDKICKYHYAGLCSIINEKSNI